MSENVFLLFALLPHCCYPLHLQCTTTFRLSCQTGILSFILMFLAQHRNINFLSGLGLDILKTGSCEILKRHSAVSHGHRCSYLAYTHSIHQRNVPIDSTSPPPSWSKSSVSFTVRRVVVVVWEAGSSGYIYIICILFFLLFLSNL